MTEQTFRSPGFFEREVDLTQRTVEIEGVPAGIIGTANLGPAFVPVTLGSFIDFEKKFGSLNRDRFGPYAVREWLKNRTAVTFIRVLGAGATNSISDIQTTAREGTVKNAGFVIKGTAVSDRDGADKRHEGSVQFIVASHDVNASESKGYPIFSDNDSFNTGTSIRLVRGMVMTATGSRLQILGHGDAYSAVNVTNDLGKVSQTEKTFKLVLSSAIGTNFGNDEQHPGIRIYTASLNPNSEHYISKILNTDPHKFHESQHLLYADFPVEDEVASVTYSATKGTVGIASGSAGTSGNSGNSSLAFRDAYGRFDTRYKTAKTTSYISQPFGSKEHDLFHFESLDDGSAGNQRVKISITNLRRSTNPKVKYGTFTVLVRDYNDTDTNLKVLEQYNLCTLDPASENYVANLIGDVKLYFNFDAEVESERRLNVSGKRPNRSQFVRIVMNQNVEDGLIPEESLPFGFRGLPLIKTNEGLTDDKLPLSPGSQGTRLALAEGTEGVATEPLSGSVLPPVPFRFKTTRGEVSNAVSPSFTGEPGSLELSDNRFFWGVKFESLPNTSSFTNAILNSNASSNKNSLLKSYSKLLGISKLDTLVTGSGADVFSNNKFTLARVALNNPIALSSTIEDSIATAITGTADEHIRDTAYIRNGVVETKNYTVLDTVSSEQRITFATLAAARNAKYFNKFTEYAKFTNMLHGGFDGLNILDKDAHLMNDKASSIDGLAGGGKRGHLHLHQDASPGSGKENNIISSYRTAANIITDPFASRVNIVAIPGIKEPFVTDYVSDKTREYSKAIYLMDIPAYSGGANAKRLYGGESSVPDVLETTEQFETRAIDNNYVATYFPDVIFKDDINNLNLKLPASIVALKALGYNDSIAYPWFAPAGFNRGALNNVVNTDVRLNAEDRNILYEGRINPIANFPNGGFVIFGQKTLQQDKSSLDRVNVRRMLLEVKRIISDIASRLIFEQNTPQTRARFVAEATPLLSTIQAQQGVDQFQIIMDSTNNTDEDVQTNRLNGRIVLVPTRAIEFIAVDFIITNSGVSFE